MANSNHTPQEQPDFMNDQLTDLVLHKDDEPVIKNGEIINEPDDVEERSFIAEDAAMFPPKNSEGDSCWFPIHFNYNGIDYTADVQKVPAQFGGEYHVSAITPVIEHIPEPYIVAEHFSTGKYDFPVNETFYPAALGDTIVLAIENGTRTKSGV